MNNVLAIILIWVIIILFVLFVIAAFTVPIYLLRRHNMKQKVANKGVCVQCGEVAYQLNQTTARGILLWSILGRVDDYFCKKHGKDIYLEVKSFNLKNGWWSLRGVIRTPFLLQENHYEYKQFLKAFNKTSNDR